MAGNQAPADPTKRRRRNAPARGEMRPTEGKGWAHGPIPEPPDGLNAVSREAWTTWFQAWFASHWTPADLPGLRIVIVQYDAVNRNPMPKANDTTALVRLMDTYGITPAGQQARRWAPPKDEPAPASTTPAAPGGRYSHLKVVDRAG